MVKKKSKKKAKKRIIKKRRPKSYSNKKVNGAGIDLQKVVDFKFKALGKIYKNFTEKRKKEKVINEKFKDRNREKQIKEEQKRLKEEEKQLKKEEEDRLKEKELLLTSLSNALSRKKENRNDLRISRTNQG